MSSRYTKRARIIASGIGKRPQEGDSDIPTAQSQVTAPSSSGLSTRVLPLDYIPSIQAICIRVFAENIRSLSADSDSATWEAAKSWVRLLPEYLVPRLFAVLRSTCPSILSHEFIATYLLRGDSITLTSDLPAVNKDTIGAISRYAPRHTLRQLELSQLDKIADNVVAPVVSNLPSLRILILRGCSKVGEKTMAGAANTCRHLIKLNVNYTSVTPSSLSSVLKSCKNLEVLKVAGISSWTDTNFAKLHLSMASADGATPLLPAMKALNIRQTALGDASINNLLAMCPNIQRIDLSFTPVRHPPRLLSNRSLEKLSLTSTGISSADLLAIVSDLPRLKKISLGALGGGQGSSAAISNTSAMTMDDNTLRTLTGILENYTSLEDVSLVGNTKLGLAGRRDSAIAGFVRRVGRRCKRLNLANIPSLRSSDLAGLLPDEVQQDNPRIQTLILNNTVVDDDAAVYISSCTSLEVLEVAGTRFTNEGLYPIIDACPRLHTLDLTSCRGVKVVDRRRFFEAWKRDRRGR